MTASTSTVPGWTPSAWPTGTAASCRPGPARRDELGIAHGEIVHAHYSCGVSFRDPDGIALEFFALPAWDLTPAAPPGDAPLESFFTQPRSDRAKDFLGKILTH